MKGKLRLVLSIAFGCLLLFATTLFVSVSAVSAVTQNCFTDVHTSDWFHDYVCWMYDNGLSSGYPDGTFRPNNNITRAESAVLMNKGYELAEANDDNTLGDLSCATNQIAKWNGSAWVCAADNAGAGGLPSGSVMFFNLVSCPVGWSEVVVAKGRAIVGVPNGGTLAGTVGTSLSDMEDRTHTHDVNPSSTGTTSSGSHNHAANPPPTGTNSTGAHTHSVNPPSTGTNSSRNHYHSVNPPNTVSTGFLSQLMPVLSALASDHFIIAAPVHNHSVDIPQFNSSTTGNHSHNVDILGFSSSSAGNHTHSVDIGQFNTGTVGDHSHNVDIPNTSSTTASTSDVIPYIQFLVCQKD